MFGRSFFSDLRNDPFFRGFDDHFRDFDSFFVGERDEFPALPSTGRGRKSNESRMIQRGQDDHQLSAYRADTFGFGGLFGGFSKMFDELHSQMESSRNDPNAFSFSQSSYMTYSQGSDGEPKVYQATTSTRQGPGGVKETRKAVRDSTTGIERMEVGQHIGSRGKIMERELNMRTGQRNERSDVVGMREEEEPSFRDEWYRLTKPSRSRNAIAQEVEPRPALQDGKKSDRRDDNRKKSRKAEYYVEEA